MSFNSVEFALFLLAVFFPYWFITNKSVRAQNILLLAASYFFYACWDWRFLSLILFSSIVDYSIGIKLSQTAKPSRRKALLYASIFVNLGLLGLFKYFNFFSESFAEAFAFFSRSDVNPLFLNVVLPVGISFYTFQTLSYSIDVYRQKIAPTRDAIAFFAFVSFFPQLVAGPIERASNLLPQFQQKKVFDYDKAVDGMRQILWGLLKKVVIADTCAQYANDIFANYAQQPGSALLLGAFFFAFQIYGDFSGYSDIAVGTARLFGFDFMENFAYPYFSRDIAEFWRRWHISLSTWFRDYVYIPLGGSKGSKRVCIRNVLVVFIVSGLWHGANLTFVAWGALHALYFIPLLLANANKKHKDIVAKGRMLPSLQESIQIGTTFCLVTLAWILFRAQSIREAVAYINGIFSPSLFSIPKDLPIGALLLVAAFTTVEWVQRERSHPLCFKTVKSHRWVRWTAYCGALLLILYNFGSNQEFIYFQF